MGGKNYASGIRRQAANKTKGSKKGNVFHRRLGALTFYQACQMLGERGPEQIREADRRFEIDPGKDVFLGGDLFRVRCPDRDLDGGLATATLTLSSARAKQLSMQCSHCEGPCRHVAAALNQLLDSKSVLGLAQPPDESVPLELLTPEELRERALADRKNRGSEERMLVRSIDKSRPWTDYVVTSQHSGSSYRVALRGMRDVDAYCSCPDFRTNRLGTCKHILNARAKITKRFKAAQLQAPYQRKNVSLRFHYGDPPGLRFNMPYEPDELVQSIVANAHEESLTTATEVMERISKLEDAGFPVHVYPDAEDFLQRELVTNHLRSKCAEIRENTSSHPLRTELLRAELLPYQLDGIAFATSAGRAILADDMGLGKTIQGIGVAELLARWADISRVLVVSPASLKSQWRSEIHRFCDRSVQLVLGTAEERVEQYRGDAFFTLCNYEQVLRDRTAIEQVPWDLIILDEGQRIKNWESKTSNVIRSLQSPFRLVLSGTPLENRLGDLFTIARFVDEQRLGPAYEFFNRHHIVDERGKTLGYHRLGELRELLSPILLRRRRDQVMKELPERTDEVIRCEPTAEQKEIHDGAMATVARITAKKFLTEMDMLRLRQCLGTARMACDSSFLVDKEEPEYSSKLEQLTDLLEGLLDDPTRKIVLFSEWRIMLDRIERRLQQFGCDFVRLDGKVPQKRRPAIVERFQTDPTCRVIMMTNAGSTGLNLQSANTVINVDLPWNPAVLEQRIARAHRMGQKRPIVVYKLVTTDSIEERLLDVLASKQNLANAAIEASSEVGSIAMMSGMEDLRRRLEQIMTPPGSVPIDESQRSAALAEASRLQQRREAVSAASGQLVGAALSLAGELIGNRDAPGPSAETVDRLTNNLAQSMETDSEGRPQLTISLPDQNALRDLATTLARLLA